MPRRPSRLSNCYVPLQLPLQADNRAPSNSAPPSSSFSPVAIRLDRNTHELRQLYLETSVISRALGSSLVELGHTKVLCEVHLSTNDTVDTGSLECTVKYAPHIGVSEVARRAKAVSAIDSTSISAGKLNQEIMLMESGLSHQLTSALLPVLPLERYPKCAIIVKILILQDDGSCLSAAISAASLALVDARVDLYDLVTSSTVAVVFNKDDHENNDEAFLYLIDPSEEETSKAQALICLAMTPNHKEVTLWSQTGRLPSSMANQAMELCRDGCRTMHKFMREAWVAKFQHS